MNHRLIATAVIEKDGKILMGQKRDDVGPYPNTWHIPGGGVEIEKETIDEAVKREIKEETGLDVAKLTRVLFDEDYEPNKHGEMTHYVFLIFHAEPTSMDAVAGDDLVKLKWFSKDELKTVPLTRPSEKYFKEKGWI